MEEKMKNLFEYLKEIYELKTRVVLDHKKFDSEIDIEDNLECPFCGYINKKETRKNIKANN